MELSALALIAAAFLLYSLISGRLEGKPVTAPLVFVAFGFLIGPGVLGIAQIDRAESFLHIVVELTLILVLFADAARIELKSVRKDHDLPTRMLIIGLPLTIILGTWLATMVFPEFSLWEAALLAALLAPTDAALGQAVVTNPSVPVRVRQTINVESGLNDGIALPAVLLFVALASASVESTESADWITFGLLQVTLGPLAGIILGYLGARLIDRAVSRGWMSDTFEGIGILALVGLCYLVAGLVGGNGFIAAFVGGMTFGNSIRNQCDFLFEFMETEGQLLMLITFLVFGISLLPAGIATFEPRHLLYAIFSLTVIRMIPVAISLVGSGVRLPTVLFLGWFGPRGLASIMFVLLIVEGAELSHESDILAVAVVTVALSTLLHGISAAPASAAYGKVVAGMGESAEMQPATELPLRTGMPRKESD
jgi:NhaP-type Na+/H+ or K+/H+ antiporter